MTARKPRRPQSKRNDVCNTGDSGSCLRRDIVARRVLSLFATNCTTCVASVVPSLNLSKAELQMLPSLLPSPPAA